jgi:RNA polymerase sigma factor (sigma-70 family)
MLIAGTREQVRVTPEAQAEDNRNQFFDSLRKRIVGAIARQFGYERAEDMAQRVMVVLLRRYPNVQKEEDLTKLAFTIKGNLGKEEFSRTRPLQEPEEGFEQVKDTAPTPEKAAIQREVYNRLEAGISQLGERCKLLIRYRLEEIDSKEIARKVGLSLETLFVTEKRCRDRLKKFMLAGEGGENA